MSFEEKNLTLRIHDLSRGGSGVSKDPEGRVVFVPMTAPGDLVTVRIVGQKKNYLNAELVEVLEPSPHRVAPLCAVYGQCGGCEWQHLDYDLQWKTKVSGVTHALSRAKVAAPDRVTEYPARTKYGYRNRVQWRGLDDTIGYFARGTNTITPIETCPIARPEINAKIPEIRQKSHAGHLARRGYKVEVQVGGQDGHVNYRFNAGHASMGFRQVNDEQNEALRAHIAALLRGESRDATLLDLFGGEGNLSKSLWDQFTATHVVDRGVRGQQKRVRFHSSDVTTWLQSWGASEIQGPVVLIADPPREGWPEIPTLKSVFENPGIETVILVGCDADAWARDVSRLTGFGFEVRSLAVFDFFPQTHHVEALAELRRPSPVR